MANALANLTRRNLGFSGDEGALLNEQAAQTGNALTPILTNQSLGYGAQGAPQPAYQGSPVDVFGQGKGYMQPDGTIVGRNQAGQTFRVQPEGTQANLMVQKDAALKRQMMQAQLEDTQAQAAQRRAELAGGGAIKPTFNADAGGYVYPPSAEHPQGKFVPVEGYSKPDKPLTEYQGQSVMFGTRAAAAHNQMKDLEDKISTSGLKFKQGAESVPLVGGLISSAANMALSPEQQQVDQAQRNFVNALMRRESGATISPSEFDNAKKQYFPEMGDSKEVLAQKRLNRTMAIKGFARGAGSGGKDIEEVFNSTDPLKGGSPVSSFNNNSSATDADIRHTAMKHGVSEAEVRRRLGI